MEQNNNEKEMLKTGAKLALKAASAPVKTMIWTTILTVLPYLFIGLLLFIVIFCVYFGTLEQVDEIYSGAQSVGERMGNVVSLYGFKTAEELEEDEENKFFKTLQMYKDIFDFSTEDISLLTQTLLYEGSNEEKIYLSEIKKDDGFDVFDDEGNFKGKFWTIVKNIITSFQRGFSTSFDGASQFLKANKNLLVPATALRKCKNLANENSKATEQCFRGYLVAEYNTVTDWEIDCNYGKNQLFCYKPIDKDVELGFLVLPNNIVGKVIAEGNQVFNIMNTFLKLFSKVTLRWTIQEKLAEEVLEFTKNMKEALNLFIFGQLADEEDTHFYYDGYIVENLKEFYKLYNNVCYDDETCNDANDKMNIIEKIKHLMEEYDPEVIKQERQNRRKVADSIIELTYTYYELTYGYSKIEKQFSEIVASNESKASVIIDKDGNSISFDDYVMLYALANYSDEIKRIIDSGVNVDERLKALMLIVRTQVYDETGFNHSSSEVTGNFSVYKNGKDIYDTFKNDSKLHQYLANISNAITGSRGRTIKVNGQEVTLTDEQINQILSSVQNGGTVEDAIKNVIPDASLNTTFFPLPEGSFWVSSEYGEVRGDEVHNAIDYAAPKGTSIYSISDGVIADIVDWCTVGDTSCGGGFGNRVYVQYSTGDGHVYYVIYAHMSSTADLQIGQTVSAGTLLGQVGSTGYSTGNHLHLEVRQDNPGSSAYAIDPSTIFDMNFGG